MRIKACFLLLAIFLSFELSAQIDQEIKSFVDSTEIMVKNGRRMILKNLPDGDISKVSEVYHYLTALTSDEALSAFHYIEDLYINLILGKWNAVGELMGDYQYIMGKTPYPISDDLVTVLHQMLLNRHHLLLYQVNQSGIDAESKKAIEILLYIITLSGQPDEHYNSLLIDFNKTYPQSVYLRFMKDFLPGRDLRGSVTLFMGPGAVIPTAGLAENFSANGSFIMGIDVNVLKIYTSLSMIVAGLRLKAPFSARSSEINLDFREDEAFHYLDIGFRGGYFIVRGDRFHFAPFVNISGSSLESRRFDPEDDHEEYEVFNSFAYGGGIHLEFLFKEFENVNMYNNPTKSYLSMKMDAGHNIINSIEEQVFGGNITYLTLALVWGFGDF